MSLTEFCCKSGGSNLNAGTRTGSSAEPGTSADFTYASGSWVAATGVFTVASGDPLSDGVAVGDFASVYADGSTVTGFVGRVTARDAATITVSLSAKSGTAPTNGTSNRTLKIGGAWAGPSGSVKFPLEFAEGAMKNSAGDPVRINFKNGSTYSISLAATLGSAQSQTQWEGYTSSYGDLGKAIFDFGTTNGSAMITLGAASQVVIADIVVLNTASASFAYGFQANGACVLVRCVAKARTIGFRTNGGLLIECEAYECGPSVSTANAGFDVQGGTLLRCIAHDCLSHGFIAASTEVALINCIADSNSGYGLLLNLTQQSMIVSCDFYNNTLGGVFHTLSTVAFAAQIHSCNFIKNGGWAIDSTNSLSRMDVMSCGFGAGTQANTSGNVSSNVTAKVSGSVNYASDVTPWSDPASGDFRITLATAKAAGRGAFCQYPSGYAGTVGYPDIGSAQSRGSSRPSLPFTQQVIG